MVLRILFVLLLQLRLVINMIIREFSKYLQERNDKLIANKTTTIKLLCEWIKFVINKNPKNHIDKIVHKEIMLAENSSNDFFIIGKSESGRVLVNALYNFALSYENYIMQKWLSDKQPKDFTN
jgi:hypothetical protein